jgi:2-amino-4-hydroxy-6-hydroxymethyldihydropteridine diphosphokinase
MQQPVFIGLGSNIGDGLKTLHQAWLAIGGKEGITALEISSPYLSEPVGMESENWFTNCVGKLETSLTATEFLDVLLAIEADFGRERDDNTGEYQDRTLDLDIIYFGQTVMYEENLTLPHPCLADRLFVLEPLVEVAGDFRDPLDQMTPAEKLEQLNKQLQDGPMSMQEIRRIEWPKEGA